ISDCTTLQRMRTHNRFDRYVVSIRTDGKFDMNFVRWGNIKKAGVKDLKVCKYCLRKLSYKGYGTYGATKNSEIFTTFSINDFFTLFPRSHIAQKPRYTSASAPLNDYPKDWAEISERHRRNKGYVCENPACRVILAE